MFAFFIISLHKHDDDKDYSLMCRTDATICDTKLPHSDGGEGTGIFLGIVLPLLVIGFVMCDLVYRMNLYVDIPSLNSISMVKWTLVGLWTAFFQPLLFLCGQSKYDKIQNARDFVRGKTYEKYKFFIYTSKSKCVI